MAGNGNSQTFLQLATITRKNIVRIIEQNNVFEKDYFSDFGNSHGKLLRPMLFYIFRLEGKVALSKKDLAAASSIELLHMATLVHDDIIDDSPKRRGVASIQSKFGKDVAVYSGDYLFTLFFKLIVNQIQDLKLIEKNIDTMHAILKGELNQKAKRYDLAFDKISYFRTIYGKTAAIFGLACYEGAVMGGYPQTKCKLARKIGEHIGVIFQIYDDILDYSATESKLKKPVLKDLNEGIYTLPLILSQESHREEFIQILKKENLEASDIKQIMLLIDKYSGIDKTRKVAEKYVNKVCNELSEFNSVEISYCVKEIFNKIMKRY